MLRKYYTGVGSRETPANVLEEFRTLGRCLAEQGFTLRSGGADGADAAFEEGAREGSNETLQIYLPWRGFNANSSPLYAVDRNAMRVAASVHPAWHQLSQAAQKLHGRNCYQVLGMSLDTPSRFLVCWTSDGCESARTRSRGTGGTATAIVLAERHGVPVFNLGKPGRRTALADFLRAEGVSLHKDVLNELQDSAAFAF